MNNKAFTLIELLAVLVVLSIATMIATPNVMKTVDNSKKEKFIIDAREIVLRSTYMYNEEEYRNNDNYFKKENGLSKIYLKDIQGVSLDKDSFGYTYDKENSFVSFLIPEDVKNEGVKINVYLKSCKNDKCHYICNVLENELDSSSIIDKCVINEE